MKFVVGVIFGIIQFVLGIVIFIAGVITGGIIVDSSYEVDQKEAKKKKQFSKSPLEIDEDRPTSNEVRRVIGFKP